MVFPALGGSVHGSPFQPSTPGLFTEEDEEHERRAMALEEITGSKADLYGTTYIPSKTEGELREALSDLKAELDVIPVTKKLRYLEAVEKCPDQVGDDQRIAFLWRTNFDAKLAAQRLSDYWGFKYELFGAERCFMPLTLSEALKDDIPTISSGIFQLIPARDNSGRAILFFDPSRRVVSEHSINSVLRVFWYTYHAALEDPEVQKRGCIWIAFVRHAKPCQFDVKLYPMILGLEQSFIPICLRAFHICHPDPFFRAISPVAKFMLGRHLRARCEVHFGTEQVVLNKLVDFGIPPSKVPTGMGGGLLLDQTMWLCDRLKLEKQRAAKQVNAASQTPLDKLAAAVLQAYQGGVGEFGEKSCKRRSDRAARAECHRLSSSGNLPSKLSLAAQSRNGKQLAIQSIARPKVDIFPTDTNHSLSGGVTGNVVSKANYQSLLNHTLRSIPSHVNGSGTIPAGFGAVSPSGTIDDLGVNASALGLSQNESFFAQLLMAQEGNIVNSQGTRSTSQALQLLFSGNRNFTNVTDNSSLCTNNSQVGSLARSSRLVNSQNVREATHEMFLQTNLGLLGQAGAGNVGISSHPDSASMLAPLLTNASPPQLLATPESALFRNVQELNLQQSPLPNDSPALVRSQLNVCSILFVPSDEKKISAYQCLIRKQIEVFTATEEHVRIHARGRNKPITLGQAGIRCRHCKGLPLRASQRGSIYFPASLVSVYQSAVNMSGFHFTNPETSCTKMPEEIKKEIQQCRVSKSTAGGGKKYWAEAGKLIGLVDTPLGIRFAA